MSLASLISIGAWLWMGLGAAAAGTPMNVGKPAAGHLVLTTITPRGNQYQAFPYEPRAGDILLYDDFNKFHHFVYKLAKTAGPTHIAMVINRPDGTPALLELTGPQVATAKVCIIDIMPRLTTYPGTVMVRRLREPLSAERSNDLYQFAQSQAGRSFALGRIIFQGSPLGAHNASAMRRELLGKTHFHRHRWYCSEIMVAAGTKAGIFNPRTMPANSTFPRDLAYDETLDLSPRYHPPLPWITDPAILK